MIADYLKEVTRLTPKFERLKEEGKSVTEDQDYHNLKQRKTRVIQLLFESMDTVNQFLYMVSKDAKLREILDEDLKSLLYDHGAFAAFVGSSFHLLDYNNKDKQTDNSNDNNYRVKLVSIAQGFIARYVDLIAANKLDKVVSSKIVGPDFYRCSAWTDFLASNYLDE